MPRPARRPPIIRPRDATLVVIEQGGAWPRWLDPSAEQLGDMAMVAQHYAGPAASLVEQVARRITRLDGGGWRLSRAVLVSNGKTDPETCSARSMLARGLHARMVTAGAGRLVLTVDEEQGERALRALEALASTLDAAPGVHVEVCLGCAEAEGTPKARASLVAIAS